MRIKSLWILLLLCFLSLNVTYAASLTKKNISEKNDKLIVYYFHGNMRCSTCRKIERYTKEAVHKKYDKDLKSGNIEIRVVNVEKGDNIHFIRDYKLRTRCVVISKNVGGTEKAWKRLDKVWTFVRNQQRFEDYIQKNIDSLRKGNI